MAETRATAPILLLANGNLNGRVIRLVADELHREHACPVRVISATRLNPLTPWPDERARPHAVEAECVDRVEAERLLSSASVFVAPPFWDPWPRRLMHLARRASTPTVCVVADVGYGERKLHPDDTAGLPDRIGVSDPVTKSLMIANGVDASALREFGSPYFDLLLARPPLPPPPGSAVRIGILANPNGMRERLTDRETLTAEGVLPAVHRVMHTYPRSRVTLRLHPRQDPASVDDAFDVPESTSVEPASQTPLTDFIATHHLIVGSYSMGLMVARLLGRPAVSYQPPVDDDRGIRREIFAAWNVPVATTEDELAAIIAERLREPGRPLDPERVLYRPGRSLPAIAEEILATQAKRWGSATRRGPETDVGRAGTSKR